MTTPRELLPDWIKEMVDLRTDLAMWPVDQFMVRKYGAHGAVRSKPSEGHCGPKPGEPSSFDSLAEEQRVIAARYPCTHRGADLSATEGTPVVVPHDGVLLYLGPATDAPFVGYGPNVALIAHADVADSLWGRVWETLNHPLVNITELAPGMVSVRYSLIGHFDIRPGPTVPLPADIWNSAATKPDTDHWRRLKNSDTVAMMSDSDAWQDPSRRVFVGQELGWVNGGMGHIHWEIRSSPLADKGHRYDPIAMWRQGYGVALPDDSRVARPATGGGSAGLLLLLALLAMSDKKRRR